jgi:hypothetical protein
MRSSSVARTLAVATTYGWSVAATGGASLDGGRAAWVGVALASSAGRVRPASGGQRGQAESFPRWRVAPTNDIGRVHPSRGDAGKRSYPASRGAQCRASVQRELGL